MMPVISGPESEVKHFGELLRPNRLLFSGYLQLESATQEMTYEYCNVSDGQQKVISALLTREGALVSGTTPRTFILDAGDFLTINTREWLREAGQERFIGQNAVLVEQITTQGAPAIAPAITSHWRGKSTSCEIVAQAFANVNLKRFAKKKSFYAFVPVVVSNEHQSTRLVLLNPSTEPDYQDAVEVQPVLNAPDGQTLVSPVIKIPPYGMMMLDLSDAFGDQGKQFFARYGGRVAASVFHVGHNLPSYFFHVDRQTRDIISGQHTQPPSSILLEPGVWWGRLREFSL